MAELRFLRALAHYDLMRLFGPIPRTRQGCVTSDEESSQLARNSITCLLLVNSDLDYAIEHLFRPPLMKAVRGSQAAAQALKARAASILYNTKQRIA